MLAAVSLDSYLGLVQGDLHFLCTFARMGVDDPGDWVCADGISYLGVGVASLLVLSAPRSSRSSRSPRRGSRTRDGIQSACCSRWFRSRSAGL